MSTSKAHVADSLKPYRSSTVNDEIHAPMGGVRDSGWGRTGPGSIEDFTDLIWINARSTPRQYPF
jgi:acyl-CoA reductase-like NAD-dependent aldehyde dehydrogenase